MSLPSGAIVSFLDKLSLIWIWKLIIIRIMGYRNGKDEVSLNPVVNMG